MKTTKLITAILCIAVGIACIALGIVSYCYGWGKIIFYSYYGGDAYTGIQQAAADTGNNVSRLCKICSFSFGSILVIAGLVITLKNVNELVASIAKKPQQQQTVQNDNLQ